MTTLFSSIYACAISPSKSSTSSNLGSIKYSPLISMAPNLSLTITTAKPSEKDLHPQILYQ